MPHKSNSMPIPPMPLRIHLFGQFRAESGTTPIRLPAHKVESLLAYLVLHPEPHSREQLAALLWGDVADSQARHSLRTALNMLRRQTSDDLLFTDRDTVQLSPSFPLWVDAKEFQLAADARRQINGNVSIGQLQSIISLYQGDLLLDFYDDWILAEREYLRNLYLEALLGLTQQLRAASEYERAIESAQRALASDPASERAHQHLMFCYIALGKRDAALQQYHALGRALRTELAVEPSAETTALYQWIQQAPPPTTALAAQITNLPIPLSSFVGRKIEMGALKQILKATQTGAEPRLVTLTGTGGSGKTRLAIQIATDLIDNFHDGAWWVDLAALADESLVLHAVAKALGLDKVPGESAIETLTRFLRTKQLLLVVDNCEHLIGVCAQIADTLLTHCPKLKILVTSREALHVSGEHVFDVPMLSVPDAGEQSSVQSLLAYDSVKLFVERARAVRNDFVFDEPNAHSIAQICQRLDGIPLALELAAARTNALSVQEISARLVDRFKLLTQGSRTALPRHQTLRATIDWSHDLLTIEEQVLFRRLAVFVGGWTLEAAETVCAGERIEPQNVLDLLSHLVDKSLVVWQARQREPRYQMLETIRQYAHDKIVEAGEERGLRQRHAEFFAGWAEHAESRIFGPEYVAWGDWLDAERDNLRAVLEWGVEFKSVAAPRIAKSLWHYWFLRDAQLEALAWCQRILGAQIDTPAELHAYVLLIAANCAHVIGQPVEANQYALDALDIAGRTENSKLLAGALTYLGTGKADRGDPQGAIAYFEKAFPLANANPDPDVLGPLLLFWSFTLRDQGEYDQAQSHFQEVIDLGSEMYAPFFRARGLVELGILAFLRGDIAQSRAYLTESLGIATEIGKRLYIALCEEMLGRVYIVEGDLADARSLLTKSLTLRQELNQADFLAFNLEGWARLASAQGAPQRATRLLGAISASLIKRNEKLARTDQELYSQTLNGVQQQLDAVTYQTEWAEGTRMNLEQAIVYALAGA